MNKKHLPLVFTIIFSLLGFTPGAFATTMFGINLDFRDATGAYAGGGFIQFSVDPQALPFEQHIDLGTVHDIQMIMWVRYPFGNQEVFTLADLYGNLHTSIFVENNNPLFPVELSFIGPSDNHCSALMCFDHFSEITQGHNHLGFKPDHTWMYLHDFVRPPADVYHGTWTATMWFDDPVPPIQTPVPAAAWLFGSGLLGLFGVARRKARA